MTLSSVSMRWINTSKQAQKGLRRISTSSAKDLTGEMSKDLAIDAVLTIVPESACIVTRKKRRIFNYLDICAGQRGGEGGGVKDLRGRFFFFFRKVPFLCSGPP